MRRRIGISVSSENLYKKLCLLLRNDADCIRVSGDDIDRGIALLLTDDDGYTGDIPSIILGNTESCHVPLPFRHEELLSAVDNTGKDGEAVTVSEENRTVRLLGREIRLTDVEFRLFSTLYEANGEFISRERLLDMIWGEGYDSGVVNVYIHYLRGKLEADGRRIILSSRKEGYSIDKKYGRRGLC